MRLGTGRFAWSVKSSRAAEKESIGDGVTAALGKIPVKVLPSSSAGFVNDLLDEQIDVWAFKRKMTSRGEETAVSAPIYRNTLPFLDPWVIHAKIMGLLPRDNRLNDSIAPWNSNGIIPRSLNHGSS